MIKIPQRGIKLGIEFGERYGDWNCSYCHRWIYEKYELTEGLYGPIYHPECFEKYKKEHLEEKIKEYEWGDERHKCPTKKEFKEGTWKIYINKPTNVRLKDDNELVITCPKCKGEKVKSSGISVTGFHPVDKPANLTKINCSCPDCKESLEVWLERMEKEQK